MSGRSPPAGQASGIGFLDRVFVDRGEISVKELRLGEIVGLNIDQQRFESFAWLVTEVAETGLAEVFEVLVVSLPAVSGFVVLASVSARYLLPTGDTDDRGILAAGVSTKHTRY